MNISKKYLHILNFSFIIKKIHFGDKFLNKSFDQNRGDKQEPKHILNNNIRANQIVLLSHDGEKLGTFSFRDAMNQALEQQLDLMQVSRNGDTAFCKIINFDSWMYHEKKKKDKQDFKNRSHGVKSMQFSPEIGENDLKLKLKKVSEFIEDGHKVKVVIKFKFARQASMKELNKEIINAIIQGVQETASLDSDVSYAGREINFMLKPAKKQNNHQQANPTNNPTVSAPKPKM